MHSFQKLLQLHLILVINKKIKCESHIISEIKFINLSQKGSSNGGTIIVIDGDGFFPDYTVIQIGGMVYTKSNANISYSKISLVTESSSVGIYAITIFVNGVSAVCSTNCSFEFSSVLAPTVSSVFPTNFSAATMITINGNKFGDDMSIINVTIGQSNCIVNYISAQNITCYLSNLNVGKQYINVYLNGKYFASLLLVNSCEIKDFRCGPVFSVKFTTD